MARSPCGIRPPASARKRIVVQKRGAKPMSLKRKGKLLRCYRRFRLPLALRGRHADFQALAQSGELALPGFGFIFGGLKLALREHLEVAVLHAPQTHRE